MSFIKKHIYTLILCSLLFFIGYKLISNLLLNPLEIDELFTLGMLYMNDISHMVLYGNILDNHPPLYHLVMFVFTQIFGLSEYVIRIPSIIFYLITLCLIFKLSKKLFSPIHGITSVIVTIVLMPNAWITQYARGYSLLLLLSVITMIFLVDIINNKLQNINREIQTRTLIYFIISSLMCMYTHYFGCILVLSELIFLFLLFYKNIFKEIIIISVSLTLLFGPWLLISHPKKVITFFPNFFEWLSWNSFGNFNAYALLLLIVIGIIYYLISIKNLSLEDIKKQHFAFILLLFLFIFPFALTCFIHYFIINCYRHNYLIISLIPFYMLIANTFVVISKKKTILFIILFIFILCSLKQTHIFIPFNTNSEYFVNFIIKNYNRTKKTILIINRWNMFGNNYKYHFDKYISSKENIIYIEDYSNKNIERVIYDICTKNNNKYIWLFDATSIFDIQTISKDIDIIVIKDSLPSIYLVKPIKFDIINTK